MDDAEFQYILSNQQNWAILYKEQQAKYKLEKNRKEKAKAKIASQTKQNKVELPTK